MFNKDQHTLSSSSLSPRISFSNDFADTQQIFKPEFSYREAPVSSDFEFSVRNDSMMSADELFFKGKLLPLKENCTNSKQIRKKTLRDELLVDDDGFEDAPMSMAKGSGRRKEWLGLKRVHNLSKKANAEGKGRGMLIHEEVQPSRTVQELLSEGGSSYQELGSGM
ncbi:uncharacterized protein LOC131156369 [Malania oleifera]|uniref:uncharacterized protein LOC131156369 n=1 Tax=Malania oleifera TaxID=397392 RepID=UPI0025ADE4EB|nr:uncharacterized protein LOC131156369 [Malania oleifera]